jgi:hypothetical protein
MTDAGTAITMELLVDDIFALDERIHAGQKRLGRARPACR